MHDPSTGLGPRFVQVRSLAARRLLLYHLIAPSPAYASLTHAELERSDNASSGGA